MIEAPLQVTAAEARAMKALMAARDPYQFAKLLGVRLNPAQRRWLSLVGTNPDGWSWRLKLVMHVAANQIGKSLGLAVLIMWACWNKIGVPTADTERWMRSPYSWFHLAPKQQQAYLVLNDIRLLMAGDHPAQIDPFRLPAGQIKNVRIEDYYDGLEFWNGALVQFRTTDDQAKALQGRRAAGISYDEAAFENHLKSVVNEVLMMRLIASGGPLWLVSTPDGINDFYEFVIEITEDAEKHNPRKIAEEGNPLLGGSCVAGDPLLVWEDPVSQSALVWSTVEDNVGYGLTREGVDRMEAKIDPATKEQQLRGAFLDPADAFFVPTERISHIFATRLPEHQDPLRDHLYVISWDPSDAKDPTACIVLDVTQKPWVGVDILHWTTPRGEPALLQAMYEKHAYYNGGSTERQRGQMPPRALSVWDGTGMGGSMLTHSLAGLTPRHVVQLAGERTKTTLLTNMRAELNSGSVILPTTGPSWASLRRQILSYKVPDKDMRQDLVMALLGAVDAASKGLMAPQRMAFAIHGRS